MLIQDDLFSHNSSTHHFHYDPHITALKNASISKLSSFSGLILTITLVVLALLRLYVYETLLPRIYRKTWPLLVDDTQRRNFINHHVAATLKITMVASQIYPLLGIAFGHLTLQSPISKHSQVTTGDIMIVGLEIFVSMYVFELFYRARVSYISTLHHVCAAVIAQSAVAIGIDYIAEKDATIEFIICFLWGKSCALPTTLLTPSRDVRCYRRTLATLRSHPLPSLPRSTLLSSLGIPCHRRMRSRRYYPRNRACHVVLRRAMAQVDTTVQDCHTVSSPAFHHCTTLGRLGILADRPERV
jgi:hypothetical protein